MVSISSQLNMFRAIISPILRSTWLCLQLKVQSTDDAAGRQLKAVRYTSSCKHSLVLLRMGKIIARNMLSWELIETINKLLLLHLVGCLYHCNRYDTNGLKYKDALFLFIVLEWSINSMYFGTNLQCADCWRSYLPVYSTWGCCRSYSRRCLSVRPMWRLLSCTIFPVTWRNKRHKHNIHKMYCRFKLPSFCYVAYCCCNREHGYHCSFV